VFWFSLKRKKEVPTTGLILPGGGARNAYQVGVLKAVAELIPDETVNPFPVITGTSSGALNAALLASNAAQFQAGVRRLLGIWENFTVDMVFRSDTWPVISSGTRWLFSFLTGGHLVRQPPSLLDSTPLRRLMEGHYNAARIQQGLDYGTLRALAVTVSGYETGQSVSYFHGAEDVIEWERTRRCGRRVSEITLDHLMASSAIPLVFPAVRLGNEYFGDGSMRETAPLSPALHLGANRLLIISVRGDAERQASDHEPVYPGLGQISGYIFDTLFLDSLDADIERLNRINHTIGETREKRVEYQDTALRPIEFLVISPSIDIRELVEPHISRFPRSVRVLLAGLGALTREGRELISYLMFESPFCHELIELGYADAMSNQARIRRLLGLERPEEEVERQSA
jgi:NTE family protein